MIFKLAEATERSWRRLDGHNQVRRNLLHQSRLFPARQADGLAQGRRRAAGHETDRLGRSTRELLDLIERIGKAGAAFRSLGDPSQRK